MIEDLDQLRESIDVLDNKILKALAQRMKLSDRVITAKKGSAAFRPGREAALVRQLVAKVKANGLDIAPEVVLCVWRQIMAASLGRQDGELVCEFRLSPATSVTSSSKMLPAHSLVTA